jgi:hypothetical protein
MPKTVAEAYDELWHYTSSGGAQGIISSGSVWATSAAFLNDSTELKHFFDVRLIELARPVIRDFAQEKAADRGIARKMKAAGGIEKIVNEEVLALVGRYRSATLHVNDPHIFSMTAPTDEGVRAGGLLSQWRGYGPDGGCALVLDPAGIDTLLQEEARSFAYQHMQWGDVYYYGVDRQAQPSTEDIALLEETIAVGIASQIRGQATPEEGEFYSAMTSLSCLYKHWGFHEEREVRIIAVPSSPDIADAARQDGEDLPLKPSKTFLRSGIHVPYIELFARTNSHSPKGRLPLKRVVIGPHIDAENRRLSVERLLRIHGYSVPVVCSEIPYLGR